MRIIVSALLFVVVSAVFSESAKAESGEVIGSVYSTGILAQIGSIPIPSYGIEGKTAVAAEDFKRYNFVYTYDEETLTHYIWSDLRNGVAWAQISGIHHMPKGIFTQRGEMLGVTGSMYSTDAVVYVDGYIIPSFEIDGRVCVALEDIGNILPHKACYWDERKRTISLLNNILYMINISASALPDSGGYISIGGSYVNEKSAYVIKPANLLEKVSLHAEPAEGFVFVGWYTDITLVSLEASCTVEINEERHFEARFMQIR